MPFGFFQFWKKTEPKSKIPISEIPIFASLGPGELELIESKIRRVEYKKGDIVYRVGEKAEAFYIILLGRFRVIGPRRELLTILSQGDYFGESSILLGRDHSATVEAKNDGMVLRVEKKDFQDLLGQIPSLSLHLSRTLGHRLTAGTARAEISRTKIVAIYDYGIEVEKSAFAWNFAATLGRRGKKKAILLGLESPTGNRFAQIEKEKLSLFDFHAATLEGIQKLIREQNGAFHFLRVANDAEGSDAGRAVVSLLAFLMDRYDFVLLDLPPAFDDLVVKALQQSDAIYFLVAEESRPLPKVLSFLKEFRTSFGFTRDEIRYILCQQQGEGAPSVAIESEDNSLVSVFSVLPYEERIHRRIELDQAPFVFENPESPYANAVRFLARELTGKLVGLALGSGAAFGFAHVGVLSVLEREQIPIDMIAGSSIGALIGTLWASGLDAKALEEIALSLDQKTTFLKLIGFQDFSLPHHGFFKGDQVTRFLRSYLGHKTFRMLNVPVKIVASNLFTGEGVIFDEGDVVDAVRASISIPGIFRPVRWRKEYLIDGGVVDPLPVKILSQYGVKKIIAVNVLSAAQDHIQRQAYYDAKKIQMEEVLRQRNVIVRAWFRLFSRLEKRYRANIFNVLMNTIQFLEYGMAESAEAGADIVIHPVLPDAHWAEFYSAGKFIRQGEKKAMEQLADIKRLVEEGP